MPDKAPLDPFDYLSAIDRRNLEQSLLPVDMPLQVAGKGLLAVRVGEWRLLFAMEAIAEITPVPRITRVPGLQPWLLGIANSRGAIIAVVDVQAFLGGQPTRFMAGSRILLVHAGEWCYGLVVDEIIGTRQFDPVKQQNDRAVVASGLQPYITQIFLSEQSHWLVFDVGRLLNDPRFLQAASR